MPFDLPVQSPYFLFVLCIPERNPKRKPLGFAMRINLVTTLLPIREVVVESSSARLTPLTAAGSENTRLPLVFSLPPTPSRTPSGFSCSYAAVHTVSCAASAAATADFLFVTATWLEVVDIYVEVAHHNFVRDHTD